MAFSRTEEEVLTGGTPATSKRRRRTLSARTLILLACVAIGVVSGLVGRATSDWTGFGVGFGLFALLVVVGTPYLYGPLMSRAQIKRLEAELAEQARREAGAE
jgi:uncharacterized membrane protein YbjE (DUF340 family)